MPLIETLSTYFDAGCVAAEAARRLSLSVRALTYRLESIHRLTGADPADPVHRYTVQTAVIGARLLDWPEKPFRHGGFPPFLLVGCGWGRMVSIGHQERVKTAGLRQ